MTIYLDDSIDSGSVRQVLIACASRRPLNIFINSVGGSITDALAIYDVIVNRDATVIALGQCCSAALLVLLGGARRWATPHCRFMLHPVASSGQESIADERERQCLSSMVMSIIKDRTGFLHVGADKLYFSAEEAIQMGFIHRIWNAVPARSVSLSVRSVQ